MVKMEDTLKWMELQEAIKAYENLLRKPSASRFYARTLKLRFKAMVTALKALGCQEGINVY